MVSLVYPWTSSQVVGAKGYEAILLIVDQFAKLVHFVSIVETATVLETV